MKNQMLKEFQLYRFTLSGQSTPEVIVALGPAATAGVAWLLVPFPLNR